MVNNSMVLGQLGILLRYCSKTSPIVSGVRTGIDRIPPACRHEARLEVMMSATCMLAEGMDMLGW